MDQPSAITNYTANIYGDNQGVQVGQNFGTINTTDELAALTKLAYAKGAAFDSHGDGFVARCHPDTRVEIRETIKTWAEAEQSECIFWLKGVAGTGKSTVARTVAQSFADRGELGASFFFKRGEPYRGNAALFFATIAVQAATFEPLLRTHLATAVKTDPSLPDKVMAEQFEKLILEPLRKLEPAQPRRILLVIDALDECEGDEYIKTIIQLLALAKNVLNVSLKVFVTSRPELPIRLGFSKVSGTYQDIALHDVPASIIQHDIGTFFESRLHDIREDYNRVAPTDQQLCPGWPGPDPTRALVEMAVPLFVVAATICRFLEDTAWSDPKGQLQKVLGYQRAEESEMDKLDATYRPVLDQLLLRATPVARARLIEEFRYVVGSIVLLAEPLSAPALAGLLDILKATIDRRLMTLHSVLSVPTSAHHPIRIFHLSFRDFLVDPSKQETNPFWIDEKATHVQLASLCLRLLGDNHLKEDLCNLNAPDANSEDVSAQAIQKAIPIHVRYACLYWVHHLEQSHEELDDAHPAYSFLNFHFLHWLEALSLLRKLSESLGMVDSLQSLVATSAGTKMSAFLQDARRFILSYRYIISRHPLQLYSSAIIFSPLSSIVRATFKHRIPPWISLLPNVDDDWNAYLQTMEGHLSRVTAFAFSSNGKTLTSSSWDGTIISWNLTSGMPRQVIRTQHGARALGILSDGKILLSVSSNSVQFWDAAMGSLIRTMNLEEPLGTDIALSPDGTRLISASISRNVKLWNIDIELGAPRLLLENQEDNLAGMAFSADSRMLAMGGRGFIILFDTAAGTKKRAIRSGVTHATALAFNSVGNTLAAASNAEIQLWDCTNGSRLATLQGSRNAFRSLVFSPDGETIAAATERRLWFWNIDQRVTTQIIQVDSPGLIGFSPDWTTFAVALENWKITLWDATNVKKERSQLKSPVRAIEAVVISLDGKTVASISADETLQLWDSTTGSPKLELVGHRPEYQLTHITFATNGKTLASSSMDRSVRLWDVVSGAQLKIFCTGEGARAAIFFPDGSTIAVGLDMDVEFWDLAGASKVDSLRSPPRSWRDIGSGEATHSPALSQDGKFLFTESPAQLRIWDLKGKGLQKILKWTRQAVCLAISGPSQVYDGHRRLAIATSKEIWLLNTQTYENEQKISTDGEVSGMDFTEDGQFLKTNRGVLQIPQDILEKQWSSQSLEQGLALRKDWLALNQRRILWIPAQYGSSVVALYGNTVALGQDNGQVLFLGITFANTPFWN